MSQSSTTTTTPRKPPAEDCKKRPNPGKSWLSFVPFLAAGILLKVRPIDFHPPPLSSNTVTQQRRSSLPTKIDCEWERKAKPANPPSLPRLALSCPLWSTYLGLPHLSRQTHNHSCWMSAQVGNMTHVMSYYKVSGSIKTSGAVFKSSNDSAI